MAETPPPTTPIADDAGAPTPRRRGADWTLVQLTGGLAERTIAGRAVANWTGRWVALNQAGELYLSGSWTDCWESAKHWAHFGPPVGAAYGEAGPGWRGPVPGLDADADR